MINSFEKLKKLYAVLFLTCLVSYIIFNNNAINYNFLLLASYFIIAEFSLIQALRLDGMPYSLNKIFYIFSLFFFGISPGLQYKNRISFWGSPIIDEATLLALNIIIIFILLTYAFFYKYFIKRKRESNISNCLSPIFSNREVKNYYTFHILLILFSLVSFFLFFSTRNFNPIGLLYRGGILSDNETLTSSTALLIADIFIRPVPIICLMLYKIYSGKSRLLEMLLFCFVLISNFPTAMPRFQAAALYIGLSLVYFKKMFKGINFPIIIAMGILVLLPFLNLFRVVNNNEKSLQLNFDMFLLGDFDSYQNFGLAIDHKFITYGEQLLGVFLFFVPRAIWPSKPIGSGAVLADKLNLNLSNISMNYFAEGYVNFGFFGIIIFSIILSYINSNLDKLYWPAKSEMKGFASLYVLLIGMEFFVLRGDLLSSFAYTIGLSLAVVILTLMLTGKTKRKIE